MLSLLAPGRTSCTLPFHTREWSMESNALEWCGHGEDRCTGWIAHESRSGERLVLSRAILRERRKGDSFYREATTKSNPLLFSFSAAAAVLSNILLFATHAPSYLWCKSVLANWRVLCKEQPRITAIFRIDPLARSIELASSNCSNGSRATWIALFLIWLVSRIFDFGGSPA